MASRARRSSAGVTRQEQSEALGVSPRSQTGCRPSRAQAWTKLRCTFRAARILWLAERRAQSRSMAFTHWLLPPAE